MLFSICIATYNRIFLLEKLLISISNQVLLSDMALEVLIVDNDPNGSAKEVVKKIEKTGAFQIRYFIQPIKNISLTRNKAVKKSKGDFLLFIDDDEVASKEWLISLYNTIDQFNSDGAFGRVVSYFPPQTPNWIKNCFIYNRSAPATGTIAEGKRTGNCILKASLLKTLREPFNPEFGLTGGEDTMLFDDLANKGAKFVNSKEAVTYEFVPAERTKLSWLISRAFGTGNNFARRSIEFSNSKEYLVRASFIIRGVSYMIGSICLFILQFYDKGKRLHWLLKTAANWGKVVASLGYFPRRYS